MADTKIYPYIDKIKSLEAMDENFNVAFLYNNEKVLVYKDYKVDDKLFILPQKTICSFEFYQTNPVFDAMYSKETYEILPFSYEGEMFTNRAIPLELLTLNNNLSLPHLQIKPLNSPIKSIETLDFDSIIVVPDYSKESINYVFEPVTYEDDEEYSLEGALSVNSIKSEWINNKARGYDARELEGYDVDNAWFNGLNELGYPEIAKDIQNTPKYERVPKIKKYEEKYPKLLKRLEDLWLKWVKEFITINKIPISDIIRVSFDCVIVKGGTKVEILDIAENVHFEKITKKSTEEFSMEDLKVPSTPNSKQILKADQIEKLLEVKSLDDFKRLNVSHRDWITSIFSNRVEKELNKDGNPTKKVKILPSLIPIEGYFTLPANTLPNQPKDIETTAGLYVFNMFVIAAAFKHKIPYINHEMKAPDISKLNNDLSYLLIENKIQIKDELEVYWNNITFISYMTEIFMPGIPVDFIEELPEVKKLKKELCEKYKDEIAKGDAAFYADNVEKPLLKLAESILKNHPSWDIYGLDKKPSFSNNYKTCFVSNGPIYNSIKEGYDIVTNAFDDGIDRSKYDSYCNQLIYGTYNRAVKTAFGGALSKTVFNSLSSIKVGDAGSDCKTEKTYNFVLDKSQKTDYLYTYIRNPFYGKEGNKVFPHNDKWIELTPEVIDMFIGKEVQMRSPLYCESEKYCNKCLGNLFNRMGINNVSLTAPIMFRELMAKSMKAFHDASIKTIKIKMDDYIAIIDK